MMVRSHFAMLWQRFRTSMPVSQKLFMVAGLFGFLAIAAGLVLLRVPVTGLQALSSDHWVAATKRNPASTSAAGAMAEARSAPPTDWLKRAAEYVASETNYASHSLQSWSGEGLTPTQREIFTAIAAVRYITNRMSPLRYGAIVELSGLPAPSSAPLCIEMEAGICGSQVEASLQLLRALGLTARSLQFYWTGLRGRQSHIVLEAYAGGQWRFMDATWNAWFVRPGQQMLDIASFDEVVATEGRGFDLLFDQTAPTYLVAHAAGSDVLEYLRAWPDMIRIVGMSGTVPLTREPATSTWRAVGVPSFFGRTLDHGVPAEGTIVISIPAVDVGTRRLLLDKAAPACASGVIAATDRAGIRIAQLDLDRSQKSDEPIELSFAPLLTPEEIRLEVIATDGTVCYIVFASIAASR